MHIEPGVLNAAKVLYANAVAIATLAAFSPKLLRPDNLIKTGTRRSVFLGVHGSISFAGRCV